MWEGETGAGVKVIAFIARVATQETGERLAEFERDLQATRTPRDEDAAIPLRMLL